MEQREIRVHNIDFRNSITENGEMVITGYVNETEKFSDPLAVGDGHNYFVEKIKKGAFTRAIERNRAKGFDIDFLAEHDDNQILASTRNNSLYLEEDERGLYVSAVITPTSWGKDFYQLVSSGIIQNFSFGFRSIDDDWDFSTDGVHTRVVNDLDLIEVSLVRHPAYPQSFAEARGLTSSETIYKNELRRYKEKMDKENLEKREEVEEKQETTLDLTETIISIDAKLEELERKLNEVLGIFLDDVELEQEEKEQETIEEKEEETQAEIEENDQRSAEVEEVETEEPTVEEEATEERNQEDINADINKQAIELIKEKLATLKTEEE